MTCSAKNCPELETQLRKYYTDNALNVSGSTNWVKPGTSWVLNFSNNYTGWLDIHADRELLDGRKDSIENKWLWVQDGVVVDPVPANIAQGNWTPRFRRRMPDFPTDMLQETPASFSNNSQWSNKIVVYFQDTNPFPTLTPTPTKTPTPTPTGGCQQGTVPGDANGDCKVDGFDYVVWWQNFGTGG